MLKEQLGRADHKDRLVLQDPLGLQVLMVRWVNQVRRAALALPVARAQLVPQDQRECRDPLAHPGNQVSRDTLGRLVHQVPLARLVSLELLDPRDQWDRVVRPAKVVFLELPVTEEIQAEQATQDRLGLLVSLGSKVQPVELEILEQAVTPDILVRQDLVVQVEQKEQQGLPVRLDCLEYKVRRVQWVRKEYLDQVGNQELLEHQGQILKVSVAKEALLVSQVLLVLLVLLEKRE